MVASSDTITIPTAADVDAAAARIKGVAIRTPLLNFAVLDERLGADPALVSAAYLRAYQQRPARAEPLVALASFHRRRGEHHVAFIYAREAAACPRPSDLLFVEAAAYEWRALDELAISAFYAGKVDEGRSAIERLVEARFPEHERTRISSNRGFYFPCG